MCMYCYTNKNSKGWKKAANPLYIKSLMLSVIMCHYMQNQNEIATFSLRWKIRPVLWFFKVYSAEYKQLFKHKQLNDYAKRILINYLMSTCSKDVITSDQSQGSTIKVTLPNTFILILTKTSETCWLYWWQVGSDT